MADSGGTFGGNGSVFWSIDCRHLKGNPPTSYKNGRHQQHGQGGTAPAASFEIKIKHPDGPGAQDETNRLAGELTGAVQALLRGDDIEFHLRIEKGRHEQVVVGWDTADENFNPDSV